VLFPIEQLALTRLELSSDLYKDSRGEFRFDGSALWEETCQAI